VQKRLGLWGFRDFGCVLADISEFNVMGLTGDVSGVNLPL
jgi:hypothetical protein